MVSVEKISGVFSCTIPLGECERITHMKNRGEITVPVDSLGVVVPPTVIIPASVYLNPVLSQEIASIN